MVAPINLYTKGTRIWLKDPVKVWLPGRIIQDYDDSGTLFLEKDDDATKIEIKITEESSFPYLRNPEILLGENNLTNLSHLHEPAVLHNLCVRFIRHKSIYTYCGIILVAVNPYKALDIYDNATIRVYMGKAVGELDPHIYAVAEEAFAKMERNHFDQSIIVSGESGAGKTVSAKHVMRYFAFVGGTSITETQIEKKILSSSPIMEAIGNAKTTRNDNSSRFGKYISIGFNKTYHIIGANMRTYLLEKSRVVFQTESERNYHIFYQMCVAAVSGELSDLGLQDSSTFNYLNGGNCHIIEGVSDISEFNTTKKAFRQLNFSADDISSIFSILASILHLGNIGFLSGTGRKNDSETSYISADDAAFNWVVHLLQIDADNLRKWLCHRKIVTGRETCTTPMNVKSAKFARDALSKYIYSRLFDWIVKQINRILGTTQKINKSIGVLDIYGFETFDINSFEQFCINFANEKLQQQFNLHVFKLEQEEYLKEGIQWKMIHFYDNQPCIDLIESKLGILDLLDEECRMPKGSDASWVEKLYSKCTKCQHFSKPRFGTTSFIVKHFADQVEYLCDGFLDKNRDTVMEEQIKVLLASSMKLLSSDIILKEDVGGTFTNSTLKRSTIASSQIGTPNKPTTPQKKRTIGAQFGDSLNLLMNTLNATTPHYVRCIKPNDTKESFYFEPQRSVQQLRACGVLETVRISAAGFPSRWNYYDFFVRYRVLCRIVDKNDDYHNVCQAMVVQLLSDPDKYRFGKSKLFFRAGQVAFLEKLRFEKLRFSSLMIQKHVRGWLRRIKYLRMRHSAIFLQCHVRSWLARALTKRMRHTRAAIRIQRIVRGWIAYKRYKLLRQLALRLQALHRGNVGRILYRKILRDSKAIILQRNVRGWIQRKKFVIDCSRVIVVQSCVRRFLARRQLRRLKVQARSVEHQKKLNQGLENKIISLQQQLMDIKKERDVLKGIKDNYEALELKNAELQNKCQEGQLALCNLEEISAELSLLRHELNKERKEHADNNEFKDAEINSLQNRNLELTTSLEEYQSELSETKCLVVSQQELQVDFQRAREENNLLKAEVSNETMAYQRLLLDYSRLERLQLERQNENDESEADRSGDFFAINTQGDLSLSSSPPVDTNPQIMIPLNESAYFGSDSVSGVNTFERDINNVSELKVRCHTSSPDAMHLHTINNLRKKLEDALHEREKLQNKVNELESSKYSRSNDLQIEHKHESEFDERNLNHQKKLQNILALQKMEFNLFTKKLSNLIEDTDFGVDDTITNEFQDRVNVMLSDLFKEMEDYCVFDSLSPPVSMSLNSVDRFPSLTGSSLEVDDVRQVFEAQKSMIQQLQQKLDEASDADGGLINRNKALNEHCKKLKDQIKILTQRLRETGVNVSMLYTDSDDSKFTSPSASPSPVFRNGFDSSQSVELSEISRKIDPSSYMGIMQFKTSDEKSILTELICDLTPARAKLMQPGISIYILLMMLRYMDRMNNGEGIRSLIQNAIIYIKHVVRKRLKWTSTSAASHNSSLELNILWLANVLRIYHLLKQYSVDDDDGDDDLEEKSSTDRFLHFDLSVYMKVLNNMAVWMFQNVTALIEEELLPLVVPAILEREGVSGVAGRNNSTSTPGGFFSSWVGGGSNRSNPTAAKSLDRLIQTLMGLQALFKTHDLHESVVRQIFRQTFYFICATSLNTLLHAKELCHWSRGMEIRFSVTQLEQWARDNGFQDVCDTLSPIIQAAQLLQASMTMKNIPAICEMCDRLSVCQITKLLNSYNPPDGYDEGISQDFMDAMQKHLHQRYLDEQSRKVQLLLDPKFAFAVHFPYRKCFVQFDLLEIPSEFGKLSGKLTKL